MAKSTATATYSRKFCATVAGMDAPLLFHSIFWRLRSLPFYCLLLSLAYLALAYPSLRAQQAQPAPLHPAGLPLPLRYDCLRSPDALRIDGKLDEPAWTRAMWTEDFVDIEGAKKPRPRFRTRARMLWDDTYFYIAAEMEEPHLWATLTEHDAVIFRDNDFEVFLNPSGDGLRYFEFEINALNTGWDLFLPKPYKQQGKADNSWEIPGLKTAVFLDGTLNQPADQDRGWTVEIAIPWSAFASRAPVTRPRPGDSWRVNFSRVQWTLDIREGAYRKVEGLREDNWVWSPQGIVDMHVPEHWGSVRFVETAPD